MSIYKDAYTEYSGHINVARAAEVTVEKVSATKVESPANYKQSPGETLVSFEMSLRVRVVGVVLTGKCGVCGTKTPRYDQLSEDSIRYVIANHDAWRLIFPYPEDAFHQGERDRVPLEGWTEGSEVLGLTCPDCTVKLKKANEEAVAAIRAAKEAK